MRRLQICRICLSRHRAKRCNDDSVCGIDGCQFRHNKLLHNKKDDQSDSVPIKNEEHLPSLNVHAWATTFFKVLPVFLSNGNKNIMTYAMFDDGSSVTLVDNSIVEALDLTGEEEPLCLR